MGARKECGQGEQIAIPREVESLGGGKEADQVCVLCVCVYICTYMYVTAGMKVGGRKGGTNEGEK